MLNFNNNSIGKEIRLLSWRYYAFAVALLIGLCLLLVIFVYLPLKNEIVETQIQSDSLKSFIQKSEAISQKNRNLNQEIAKNKQSWADLLKMIPVKSKESEYLSQITSLANKTNIQIENFRPGMLNDYGKIKSREVNLLMHGDYQSYCKFLNQLSHVPRLTNIKEMKIDSPQNNLSDRKYNIILSLRILYAFDQNTSIN